MRPSTIGLSLPLAASCFFSAGEGLRQTTASLAGNVKDLSAAVALMAAGLTLAASVIELITCIVKTRGEWVGRRKRRGKCSARSIRGGSVTGEEKRSNKTRDLRKGSRK